MRGVLGRPGRRVALARYALLAALGSQAALAQGPPPETNPAAHLCPPTQRSEWAGASPAQKRAMIRTCARFASQGSEAAAWAFRSPLLVALDLEASEPSLEARAAGLSRELVRALAASPRLEVVSARSFARLRALGRCGEAPDCLADVATATEAAFLLSGRLSRDRDGVHVGVVLRQARDLAISGEQTRLIEDFGSSELVGDLARATARQVAAITLDEPELAPARDGPELASRAAAPGGLLHPPPWGLWAASLGAMALGGILLLQPTSAPAPNSCCGQPLDPGRVAADLGVALLAVGGGALAASLLWAAGSRVDDPKLLLSILPTHQGLALGGVF